MTQEKLNQITTEALRAIEIARMQRRITLARETRERSMSDILRDVRSINPMFVVILVASLALTPIGVLSLCV